MRRGYFFLNFIIMQTEKQKKRWAFRSFSVVFGRFFGHSWFYSDFFPFFIPFHSFSFLNP